MPMKLFVSVTWKALPLGAQVARQFEAYGFEVTSHFLAPGYDASTEDGLDPIYAQACIEDLREADCLVLITGDAESRPPGADMGLDSSTGGRHTELGIAIALGKLVAILGPIENTFQNQPGMVQAETVEALALLLSGRDEFQEPRPVRFPMQDFLRMVECEAREAACNHKAYASAHEGYGVMLEEVRELEAEVFKKREDRDPAHMLEELIEIAAVAARFAVDLILQPKEH